MGGAAKRRAVAEPQPVEKLLYSIEDAAFALSLSRRSIGYLIANKQVSVRKFGTRTLIPASDIRRIARMDTLDGTGVCGTRNQPEAAA